MMTNTEMKNKAKELCKVWNETLIVKSCYFGDDNTMIFNTYDNYNGDCSHVYINFVTGNVLKQYLSPVCMHENKAYDMNGFLVTGE